ncbi:4680_t:CDS:10 [Ambispora leptoticha]|uniref:4680_t:CDS:1 n=1 Tax=Ambispora leptoticha TaxID=144679 RepID=A0A9N9FM00_9GLOM|nr:4680_t:CDS:10 [Ambispora leptoticha]
MALPAIIGTTMAASYLDAKYGIVGDLKTVTKRNDSKIRSQIMKMDKKGYCSGYLVIEDAARRWPNKEALVFQRRSWTFAQCEQEIGKLLGIIASLINTNLRKESLKYVLNLCKPKLAIVSEELLLNIIEINDFEIPIVEFQLSNKKSTNDAYNIYDDWNATTTQTRRLYLNKLPKSNLNNFVKPKITSSDVICYIYTSGTTGLPKAVELPHTSFISKSIAPKRYGVYFFNDRRYCPLPLYHASSLIIGIFPCWGVGATFIIGRKFSASKFWDECRITNATSIQHIGEICRYLMLQQQSINDKNHKVRIIQGNGLRSDIWQAFRERFGIELIVEFYAQTDGNAFLGNRNYGLFGLGAVGRQGPLLNLLKLSEIIVKFDFEKGVPYRDPETGRCVLVNVNEPGEIIYEISPKGLIRNYLNIPQREDPRNLFDVFKKGDFWRRTGDLLVVDKDGWCYFADRIGDTFRWKGENIASQYVAKYLCAYPDVIETTVYGLPLKAYDGQAGMAALVLNSKDKDSIKKTMNVLPRFLIKRGLPDPAIPRFIRLIDV